MGIYEQANNEQQLLEEQLADGTITETEYNRAMRDIDDEMRHYENH